jgi:hypothetical protein
MIKWLRSFFTRNPLPEEKSRGLGMLQDENVESLDPHRASMAHRRRMLLPYHGFPMIEETRTDGWVYGNYRV